MNAETSNAQTPGIFVPGRIVPPPPTVSEQARALLSQPLALSGPQQPSGTDDKDAWRHYIDESNRWLGAQMEAAAKAVPAEIVTHALPNTKMYEIVPTQLDPAFADCAIVYLHGGAYIHGAGLAGAYMAMPLVGATGIRAFAVDYRMPPEHPFPHGLEDAVDAYRWILERFSPDRLAAAGGSAGGGLAAALMLKIRDLGLPMPGACLLATPEADLTESGDSFETSLGIDVVGGGVRLSDSIALYADGHNLRDPYLSPLFGDFGRGFPPTILTCGTRDIFLSNTVLMHRALLRAGIEAELHVWEAMPHGGFFGAPEDQELLEQQTRFLKRILARTG